MIMTDLGPFEIDNIYCGPSEEMLAKLPDACIDLTVTSPPYDNLRDYKGFTLDWHEIIKQLYRVTQPGGVVVWVVADATINGSETGTSFRQALWAMECGFRLHDTMIYETDKPPMNDNRYQACFEYMFVFSKGKPETFNPIMVKGLHGGKKRPINQRYRQQSGELQKAWRRGTYNEKTIKRAIWYFYNTGMINTEKIKGHPATFPEALARDHILSWSNPGDLVLDPFMGSGTTAKMAMQNGRHYLGFDISEEYCELARKRVAWANPPLLVVG
jgi:site-specific DNA-methyltransferase (adenine-specific)